MKNCFVIMPFSTTSEHRNEKYWSEFFEMLKSDIEELGYICKRSETQPFNLIHRIISELRYSDIVLAVLTDFNSNVWYELGIRHSFKKNGTIMIIEEGQKLPFDIQQYGVIFYEYSVPGMRKLKNTLNNFFNKIADSDEPDNPVHHFIDSDNVKKNNESQKVENIEIDNGPRINTDTLLNLEKMECDILWFEETHSKDDSPLYKTYLEKKINLMLVESISMFEKKIEECDCKIILYIGSDANSYERIISAMRKKNLNKNKIIFYIPDPNQLKSIDSLLGGDKVLLTTTSPRTVYLTIAKILNL